MRRSILKAVVGISMGVTACACGAEGTKMESQESKPVSPNIVLILTDQQHAGFEGNAPVVFTSDHGGNDAVHRLEHKAMPYEESIQVPLLVSRKGLTPGGTVDREHLVSTGLDLIPTLCDYAGISAPPAGQGKSGRSLVQRMPPVEDWRKALSIEGKNFRLLHTGNFKYVIYGNGKNREMLLDLVKDPGEMENRAKDERGAGQLDQGRRAFGEFYEKAGWQIEGKSTVKLP